MGTEPHTNYAFVFWNLIPDFPGEEAPFRMRMVASADAAMDLIDELRGQEGQNPGDVWPGTEYFNAQHYYNSKQALISLANGIIGAMEYVQDAVRSQLTRVHYGDVAEEQAEEP